MSPEDCPRDRACSGQFAGASKKTKLKYESEPQHVRAPTFFFAERAHKCTYLILHLYFFFSLTYLSSLLSSALIYLLLCSLVHLSFFIDLTFLSIFLLCSLHLVFQHESVTRRPIFLVAFPHHCSSDIVFRCDRSLGKPSA